jgi:hypothetical protein
MIRLIILIILIALAASWCDSPNGQRWRAETAGSFEEGGLRSMMGTIWCGKKCDDPAANPFPRNPPPDTVPPQPKAAPITR